MTDGAVDNDYDDAYQLGVDDDIQTEPMPGGIAIDLVTRQPLFVRQVVAQDLHEYYQDEQFDLAAYKTHPYLPVRESDTVYECVFISGDPERIHKPGDTYDFPRGRLAHYPVEQAWQGGEK
jgi:hypothetical protein